MLGLQQSSVSGSGSTITSACIAAGLILLAAFVRLELGLKNPLMRIRTFQDEAFTVDNIVLFLLMIAFVPLFFFASMYAQISLGESASETSSTADLLRRFFVATQWGGRILNSRGARPTVVLGCAWRRIDWPMRRTMQALSIGSQ